MLPITPSHKRLFRAFIALAVSLGILYVLLRRIDADIFLARLADIAPERIGIIAGIFLLRTLLRALRFSLVTRTRLKEVYMISAIHAFLNKILPLRSGELTWPVLMKRYAHVTFGNAMALLLLLRYLDLLCLIFLFSMAALIVKPGFVSLPMFLFLGSVLVLQVAGLIHIRFLITLVSWMIQKIKLSFLRQRLENIMHTVRQFQQNYSSGPAYWQLLGVLVVLTVMNWLTIYAMYYHYIRMFHVEFSFFQVIVGASFVTLGNNLPLNSFGTFGTFELTWTAGFLLLGMSKDIAIPLGLFVNVSNTLLSCIVACLGYLVLILSGKSGASR